MLPGATASARPRAAVGRISLASLRTRASSLEVRGIAAFVLLLLVVAVLVRRGGLGLSFWIDEGLSVGISSHPLAQIPAVLQQDGSPPLYYLLLHVWMALFGKSVTATHMLSLLIGLLCVPAALWAGWSLYGRRAGLVAAVVAALDPFLTGYSTETRMYTLVVLLGIVTTAGFVHVFVFRRRRLLPLFALGMLLMLYTHNWAAFLALGFAVAGALLLVAGPDRRGLAIDAAITTAVVALLYAPWLPTLLFQLRHTGAPWSPRVTSRALRQVPQALLGRGWHTSILLGATAAGALVALARQRAAGERRAVVATATVLATTVLAAWVASLISPAWAPRYFATFLGPALLLLAVGLARARWIGLAALVVVMIVWTKPFQPHLDAKSNARPLAAQLAPFMRPGDLVLVTHPEQVAVLHYYLPSRLRYATEMGPVPDPGVMDWRDALGRLRAARPAGNLGRLLAGVAAGRRVALVLPIARSSSFNAPWTALMRRRAGQWAAAMARNPRVRPLARQPALTSRGSRGTRLRALVYLKTSTG